MRNFTLLAVVLALCSMSALAADYPKAEVFGGYQFTHLDGGPNANGWNFAVTGNFNNWFGITSDVSGGYATQDGVKLRNYTYTFGPVISLRANKGYTPYVHALFGGDRATAGFEGDSASSNGFATMVGGGVDFHVAPHIAVRAPQFDWLLVHAGGETSKSNVRICAGVVFGF